MLAQTRWRPGPWMGLWIAAFLLLCTSTAAADVARAELRAGQLSVALAPYTGYIADQSAEATPEQMFGRVETHDFQPLPRGNATFGFTEGAYWFHVTLRNVDHAQSRWLLVQEYALLDSVDLYVRHRDGRIEHFESGDFRPFRFRSVRYRHPNFWIDLPAGEDVDLLLRTQSKSSMQVPLTLYTPSAFIELTRDAQFAIGLYFGILLALFAYNLILWGSLRDTTHFFYSFHCAAFGLVLFCLNGLGFEYLWPDSPWLANAAVPMSMSLSMLAMQLFARDFLELSKRWPAGDRVLIAIIAFHTLAFILSAVIDYRVAVLIGTAAVFPGVLAIIVCAVVVARRGYRPATLFLLAWALFLGGTAAYAMVSFGMLPKNFATEYGIQIGSAAEMILLSFALAYRWAALRGENERIVRSANEQLEQRVQERTLELSSALNQLSEAHTRLREHSQRDGLTGVYNRRHLDTQIDTLLQRSVDFGQPFSLLLTDLDHFKQVNDQHGHLAGDDCLRAVAGLLRDTCGEHSLVARFGGEEFIVLLPGADELAARRCAELVRHSVASSPWRADGASIALTVSIGVATTIAGSDISAQALMRRADEALYDAKRAGRNRVVQRASLASR
jgi:diguanylate cyclase (GGDEF)-like protein